MGWRWNVQVLDNAWLIDIITQDLVMKRVHRIEQRNILLAQKLEDRAIPGFVLFRVSDLAPNAPTWRLSAVPRPMWEFDIVAHLVPIFSSELHFN